MKLRNCPTCGVPQSTKDAKFLKRTPSRFTRKLLPKCGSVMWFECKRCKNQFAIMGKES